MNVFKRAFGRLGQISGKKLALGAAVFLTLTGASLAGASALSNGKVAAGDCSGNSIIQCGEPNRASFISKVQSSAELRNLYAHFGLTSADYSRFISSAQPGVAYSHSSYGDNVIVVNGRVVATNAGSIGRWASYQGSGYQAFTIPGAGTYYGNVNTKAFSSSTTAIPVDVLFNAQGKMQFAVMTSTCGNAAYGSPTSPTYSCSTMNVQHISGNQYNFSVTASAGNGATITKIVYDFGDGTKTVTTNHTYTGVEHTFTKSATVTASVYVSVPGGGTVVLTNCKHAITFVAPPATYACTDLILTPGAIDPKTGNQAYALTAKATATNATIQSYTLDFGDGYKLGVVTTHDVGARFTHTYAPGSYTAKVSVTVLTNTGQTKTVTSAACAKPITVKPLVSTLACVNLDATPATPAANGNTDYKLTATASANNATITSYEFSFDKDGPTQTVTTGATTASVTHTYVPGTYTASVIVNGKDASGKAISATAPACSKPITVSKVNSNLACVSLTATPDAANVANSGTANYTFKATATTNNATITSYVFDFGDNSAKQTVTTDQTTATSAAHTYTTGNYTAIVTVNGNDASGNPITNVSAPACQTPITVSAQPKTPGITITKTVDGKKTEVVKINSDYEYEVTVTNTGETDLTNAVVTDVPADGVVISKENDGLGTIANNQWTYTIPTLAQGQSITFKFTAQLTKDSTDPVDNQACVSATTVNNNQPVCDHATVTTTPPTQPTQLINTGAGNVVGLFAAVAIVGTIAHRLFLGRRLSREG